MWNVEFCKRLKCEYRIIVVNIQTIKSMAKGKKKKKDMQQTRPSKYLKIHGSVIALMLSIYCIQT